MGEYRNLVDVMRTRACETPEGKAFEYLEGGRMTALTHAGLEARALAIAARLAETCRPGDRAMLLYPPGTEFVAALFGCMASGVIAVPAPPPHPLRLKRSLPRIQSIVASARPKAVLTDSALSSALMAAQSDFPELQGLRWLPTDQIDAAQAGGLELPPVVEDAPAVLQYTSGSTADPKGVILSHRHLLHNIGYFDHGWDHSPQSISVSWLPAFHDLGLVYGILAPLVLGFPAVLMSPVEIIQYPYRWLKAMSDLRATHSAGPNFIYDLCALKVTSAERETLDLSAWRMALTAAEPVRVDTLERFFEAFKGCGFRWSTFSPGYGLSEATCKVAAAPVDEDPRFCVVEATALERHEVRPTGESGPQTRSLAACGRPGLDVSVVIVDPVKRTLRGPDQVGEIWVGGPSVGGGYWERPDATRQDFEARLADTGAGPYLRTGDLGFMRDGYLYVTGRLKDLVIIRGENHYPQDIEGAVQRAHPSIRPGCCAAFAIEVDGQEKLAVVAEVERRHHQRRTGEAPAGSERRTGTERRQVDAVPLSNPQQEAVDVREVTACIRQAVAGACGLQVSVVALIAPGSIPKTSSGKIQRRLCREQLQNGVLEILPETEAQRSE